MPLMPLFIASVLACAALAPLHAQPQVPSILRIEDYGTQVSAKLTPYLVHVPEAKPKATAEVLITMDQRGKVTSVRIHQSSGVPALDAMALAAVQRASPLPLDNGRPVPQISFVIRNPAPAAAANSANAGGTKQTIGR